MLPHQQDLSETFGLKSNFFSKKLTLIKLGFFTIFLPACTNGIILTPPFTLTYYENTSGTGKAIRIENWGISLDTTSEPGIAIGHTIRTYYYEGQCSFLGISGLFETENKNKLKRQTSFIDFQNKLPIAVRIVNNGFSLNANRHRIGIAVGINDYSRLSLSPNSNGIVFLDTRMDTEGRETFYINIKNMETIQ